jgi:glucose uptake protein GlcU
MYITSYLLHLHLQSDKEKHDCIPGREKFFGRSLFILGEFGVNDYHLSFENKSMDEITSLVPEVIGAISIAIEVLHHHTM